eukprot:1167232-Prymnesium_polylepis.1
MAPTTTAVPSAARLEGRARMAACGGSGGAARGPALHLEHFGNMFAPRALARPLPCEAPGFQEAASHVFRTQRLELSRLRAQLSRATRSLLVPSRFHRSHAFTVFTPHTAHLVSDRIPSTLIVRSGAVVRSGLRT